MSRFDYLVRRAMVTVVIIFAIATILFAFFRAMPGDYATMLMAGGGVSAEQAEAIRAQWGLDDPIHVQYARYMVNMFTLDPGFSHAENQPVWAYIKRPMFNSVILILPATILAIIVGSIYGTLLGVAEMDSAFDKYGIIPPTIVGTLPSFFTGILLLMTFSFWLGIFPSGGLTSKEALLAADTSFLDIYTSRTFLMHYILPFVTVLITYTYVPAIVMSGSVGEVSNQPFTYFHRVKGLPRLNRFRHIMRHASLPIVTMIPSMLTRSLSGMVLTEIIFNWPGIGRLLFNAVVARDTPTVQFVYLMIAIIIVLGNFAVDILYTVIDPRIGLPDEE